MYTMMRLLWSVLLAQCVFAAVALAVDPLESYNVDPDSVTVSGLSGGAAFATQIHVALSDTIKGAATFAGVPYYCARGLFANTLNCLVFPYLLDVDDMIDQAVEYAEAGDIDDTTNLVTQKVAIWHGELDFTVNPGASDHIYDFYEHFNADIMNVRASGASHNMPTEDYGNPCELSYSPFIADCTYPGAYEVLNFLYGGNLTNSDNTLLGLLEFDQTQFAGESEYFDPAGGYAYVPTRCAAGEARCLLHIAFHGCLQGREFVGDTYARHAGYLEVAEANDIIVIFPQIKSDGLIGQNPNGCFDWWAYDGRDQNYATRNGKQVSAVKAMIDRVLDFSGSFNKLV